MVGAILVVEHALLRAGLKTRGVESGEEALEALRAGAFDLVVMDLGLPGMDGTRTCREIRAGGAGEANCDVPVLILIARSEETGAVAGLEAGAEDYVVKPFSPRELIDRVEAHLGRERRP